MTVLAWWFGAGTFVLGLVIGVVFGDALDLYRQSRKDKSMRLPRITVPTGRGVLTVLLAVTVAANLVVGLLLISTRQDTQANRDELNDYIACSTRWQQQFAAAYDARLQASVAVSTAMDAIVRAVDASDGERFRKAVRQYVTVRQEQNAERRDNPLPPLPDELCGQPPRGQ